MPPGAAWLYQERISTFFAVMVDKAVIRRHTGDMTNNTTAKKTTLTVVLPDGTTATRKTARTYTHVIAELDTAEEQVKRATHRLANAEAYLAHYGALDPDVLGNYNDVWTNGQVADKYRKEVAEYTEAIENAADAWYAATWCGRHDLAVKAIAKFSPAAVIVEVAN